jgi:hypothetical protein
MKAPSVNRTRLKKRRGATSRKPVLIFGRKSTICLFIFAIIYATFMICFQPMLQEDDAKTLHDSMKHVRKPHHVREKIRHAKDKFIQKEKDIAQMFKRRKHGGAAVAGEGGTKHKKKLDTEKDLMNKSWQKFERRSNVKIFNPEEKSIQDQIVNGKITVDNTKKTGGFMVLGMHRSGTSMLAGLLVEGFGYQPGKPLIQPAYDNAKGFYELVPAVLQNDVFMDAQGVDWSANVVNYNPEVALESYTQGRIKFERGANALRVLNNPANIPWLQKDPRCVTCGNKKVSKKLYPSSSPSFYTYLLV